MRNFVAVAAGVAAIAVPLAVVGPAVAAESCPTATSAGGGTPE